MLNTLVKVLEDAYTKLGILGTVVATSAIHPQNVTSRVNLEVIIFRRSSDPNLGVKEPT